jgi:hypothetical protein
VRLEDTAAGEDGGVADAQDRRAESEQTAETSYERALEDEVRRRHEAAERLKRDPLPDADDGSSPSES